MEEERIEQVERRIDNDKEILIEQFGFIHPNRIDLQNDVHKINTKLREVVESVRNLD